VLPSRAHYYTFLTLARVRLSSEADPSLPEAVRGWVAVDELTRMLAVDEDRVNVDIYRTRRDLAGMDIVNPAAAIERRRGQLRLGTRRVEIAALD